MKTNQEEGIKNNRPNIIFIMADDLGYGDLSCYGASKITTTNIDRIAEDGMRFMDAHSSSAVCTPSRYSVVTGRYCWRSPLKTGVLWGFSPPLIEEDRTTVASLLKSQGYTTASIGKWHLGLGWKTTDGTVPEPIGNGHNIDYAAGITGGPNDRGFDYSFNIAGSLDMSPYCFIENGQVVGIPTIEKDPYHPQQRSGLMPEGWQDDQVDVAFAEKAVDWIDQQAQNETPFFLYLTTSAPHRPCVPPEFMRGASEAGLRGDMVMLFDWVVGQIDEALQRHDLVENTLIIITSDNGARLTDFYGNDWGHKPNGELRGQKADIWDGGHREPYIVRWPEVIQSGSISDQLVCLGDFIATCADVIDVPLGESTGEDSFSLLSILKGCKEPVRDTLVHHSIDGMFAIRRGAWKLITALGSGGFTQPARISVELGEPTGQLYNIDEDIAEKNNLWMDHPEIVKELTEALTEVIEAGRSRV